MNEGTDVSSGSLDFLRSVYLDATSTIRHYDSERASFARIYVTVLSLITTALVAATSGNFDSAALVIGAVVACALSVIALLSTVKLSSLISLQRARARIAMELYQQTMDDLDLLAINPEARRNIGNSMASILSLSSLWVAMFAVFLIANVAVMIIVLLRVFS
jgi:hypothetical protein